MSLYCEKCKEETDLIADGMCIDCYKASGKDAVSPEPVLGEGVLAPNSLLVPDVSLNLAFKDPEESLQEEKSKQKLSAYFKAKVLENELVKKTATGLAWGVAGLALAFGTYSIIDPYLSEDGASVETKYYQAQLSNLEKVPTEEIPELQELAWRFIDTDGDGIPDHKENEKFGTNPLDADTDGDGVSDYQEILDGTDPLDPDDFAVASGSGSTVE